MQPPDRREVLDRLRLIESMIAEGRQATQSWGWSFLLWGIVPLVAMWWGTHGPATEWAWPVTMAAGIAVNGIAVRMRQKRSLPPTAAGRSVGAVWKCAGITVVLLAVGAVWSGTVDFRAVYVAIFALAAVAHASSSLILRWWPQFLAALVWWTASALAYILPAARLGELAAVALILGNIVFGAWLTWRDGRRPHA